MSWLDGWLSAAGSLSIQIAILVVSIVAITRLVPRMSPRTRYILWLAVPLRLCFPLVLGTPLGLLPANLAVPEASLVQANGEVLIFTEGEWDGPDRRREIVSLSASGIETGRGSSEQYRSIQSTSSLTTVLGATWAAVVLMLFSLIVRRWVLAHREVAASRPFERDDVQILLSRLAGSVGILTIPEVRRLDPCTWIKSPSVFGLRRPVILLPAIVIDTWSVDELEPVLLHELIHIRRLDPWVNVLQSVLQVVYFFHPLVWFASRRLRIERELVCDDEVVRQSGQAVSYARSMLRLLELDFSRRRALPLLTIAEKPSDIAIRIRRLADKCPDASLSSRWSVLLAVTLGVVLILVTGSQARSATAKEPMTIIGRVSSVQLGDGSSPWTQADLPVIVARVDGDTASGQLHRTGNVDVLVNDRGTPISIKITSGLGNSIDGALTAAVRRTRFPVPEKLGGPSRWTITYAADTQPVANHKTTTRTLLAIDRIPERYRDDRSASFTIVDPRSFPERVKIYREAFPEQARVVPEGPRRLLLVREGDHLELAGCTFGTASIRSVMRAVGWDWFPAPPREDPLTDLVVEGDVILRSDSSSPERVRDLERLLRSRFDESLSLSVSVERVEILVARGHYDPPKSRADTLIPALTSNAASDSGYRSTNTVNGLRMLAGSLSLPLIDTTTGGTDAQWWFEFPIDIDDPNTLLNDLSQSTGLDLRVELRDVEVLKLRNGAGSRVIGWRQLQEVTLSPTSSDASREQNEVTGGSDR